MCGFWRSESLNRILFFSVAVISNPKLIVSSYLSVAVWWPCDYPMSPFQGVFTTCVSKGLVNSYRSVDSGSREHKNGRLRERSTRRGILRRGWEGGINVSGKRRTKMQLKIRKRKRTGERGGRRRVDEELGRYPAKGRGIRKWESLIIVTLARLSNWAAAAAKLLSFETKLYFLSCTAGNATFGALLYMVLKLGRFG